MRTQTWSHNKREKVNTGFKLQAYLILGLSVHSNAAYMNLSPFPNYNLFLVFLDDIKMCGIK
jgi:hypothetical protein